MSTPQPLYTLTNCRVAYQLNWSVTLFWNAAPLCDSWLHPLNAAVEPDGVRVLNHHFHNSSTSQFLVSTKPAVTPAQLLRSIKGRLQYIVRLEHPKAFQRNYAFRSVGATKQEVVDQYIASQVDHHPMADPMATALLQQFQFHDSDMDLCHVRSTAHGQYWYNLHVVICNSGRWREIEKQTLQVVSNRVRATAEKHGYLLKRFGLLVDHVHLEIGCIPDVSPSQVVLSFMNNIVFAFQMRPMFEFSFYVGTIGEYDRGACSA